MAKIKRAVLQRIGVEIMKLAERHLVQALGQRMGVTLFVFEFGDRGNLSYISNAERGDMIAVVKEWLQHAEGGRN